MLTINIQIEAKTPDEAAELSRALVQMFSNDGAVAYATDKPTPVVTAKKPTAADKDKLPPKAPVPAKKPAKQDDSANPDPVETEASPPAEQPTKEEKPKPKRTGGRKRKVDTPTGEASPAATATTSAEELLNEAARLLAEHFGKRKPGKALKDLLAKYDATTAMDEVLLPRAAEFLADVKAMVGGAAVEAPEAPKEEKKLSEQIAEDLGI